MDTAHQLKIGSLNLEFTKPVIERKTLKDFVGILGSEIAATDTVRALRNADLKREAERIDER